MNEEIDHYFGDKFDISGGTCYSLPWCFFVTNFHISSRAKNVSKNIVESKFDLKSNFWFFFWVIEKLAFTLKFFFGWKFKGTLVKIFAKKVVRGNSVQIGPNFPAKSLSIYTKSFSWHPFNVELKITYNKRKCETNRMLCWI